MRRRFVIKSFLAAVFSSAPTFVRSETFLTSDQAKSLFFDGEKLSEKSITLTNDQQKAIQKASGVRVREDKISAWRSSNGGWLIFDNVVGKHEFIDIAVAIKTDGSVKGVEILTYRESYGGEVRNAKWRSQFAGKTADSPLKIDTDIKNISGATLSSVHITEGVKRLLATHALVLKNL